MMADRLGRELARKLLKSLSTLRDVNIKNAVIRDFFLKLEPSQIVEILSVLIGEGRKGKNPQKDCLFLVFDFIGAGGLSYDCTGEVYRLAVERGYEDIARLLLRPAPHKELSPDEKLKGDLELGELTLGERKALAKQPNRDVLDRLLYDPEPSVVRNLLLNSKITERDVLKLASRKPNSRVVLEQISESKKWVANYRVKKALVFNSYTPTEISLKLLNFLLKQDLKELRISSNVHPLIKAAAIDLLGKE